MRTPNLTKINLLYILFLVSFFTTAQELETSIFITGNTGTTEDITVLSQINEESQTLNDSNLLILGNFVSKDGYTEDAKTDVIKQFETLKSFNGKVIFTPGQNEWLLMAIEM
nr:hypothetical protein [Nonlabens ulvanivorans]